MAETCTTEAGKCGEIKTVDRQREGERERQELV
jgi:hypothetical protein